MKAKCQICGEWEVREIRPGVYECERCGEIYLS